MVRPIHVIAAEIEQNWNATSKNGVHYTAAPYLLAMHQLSTVKDRYFEDDAKGVILYFLSNASSYRGEVAKAHKAELKQIVGAK